MYTIRNGESNDMSLYRCCTTMEHTVHSRETITRKNIPRAYDEDGKNVASMIVAPSVTPRSSINNFP